MARIRSIKPDFWTDDRLTECSLSARLLFIGTWNFADDDGNLDRSAKQIKARVFPVDNVDCEPLLQELITHGLLIEYAVSDRKYLHIRGFKKHQLINRPSKPTVPGYDVSLNTHGVLTEPSKSTHAGLDGEDRKEETRLNGVHHESETRGKAEKRGCRIPEDFRLTEDRKAYAVKCCIDPERSFTKFVNHWTAKTGRDATKLDWDATWRTWCLNEQDFRKGPQKPDKPNPYANAI